MKISGATGRTVLMLVTRRSRLNDLGIDFIETYEAYAHAIEEGASQIFHCFVSPCGIFDGLSRL